MQKSAFTVIDHLSLTPNKCVVYPRFFRNNIVSSVLPSGAQMVAQSLSLPDQIRQYEMFEQDVISHIKPVNILTRKETSSMPLFNHHNFELSKTAQKNLRDKVTWLYHYARKKNVSTRKGKQLSNFKMNFATLKLPSVQMHTSDFITKNCLNQLLVEIAKKHNFKNYVWRLEYQKNGNLHYHIATDTYIDFYWLRWTWNRILNKYGYVDRYKDKFSKMGFEQYRRLYGKGIGNDFSTLQKRYAEGCRQGWKEPNSVDVKAVFGQNNIAYYISKYMAKSAIEKGAVVLPVCEDNSRNSRLWFCSRSLSACTRLSDIREAMDIDIYGILLRAEGVKHAIHDYCVVIYFEFTQLPALVKGVIRKVLELYRKSVLYEPV